MISGDGRRNKSGRVGYGPSADHGDGMLTQNNSQNNLSSSYKWPYNDSYANKVPMGKDDLKLVHKSVQK